MNRRGMFFHGNVTKWLPQISQRRRKTRRIISYPTPSFYVPNSSNFLTHKSKVTEFLQMSHHSPDVDSVIESVKPFTQALLGQLSLGVVVQAPLVVQCACACHQSRRPLHGAAVQQNHLFCGSARRLSTERGYQGARLPSCCYIPLTNYVLNGFPFSVLYGKHCWTYGKIITMKHWCTTTTTFCDTSTIKIFIILWHLQDVIHTFNNSLISYSHV
jgi:hypothetical protein